MSITTMKQFMESNNFTTDMLTADEKIYVEIYDAFYATTNREEYLRVKEQYKNQLPIFTRVHNEISGFPHGPETTDFAKVLGKEKPAITLQLSNNDGELYFDHLHDSIKHKYTENATWAKKRKAMTLSEMKKLPYTPDVDYQQLIDLDHFLDEVYLTTEEFYNKIDTKYHVGTELRNVDATSLSKIMDYTLTQGDREMYNEIYEAIKGLETKFHDIKNWEEMKFPLLNCTPSRNANFPIEFKDNYFFSSMLPQMHMYQSFKNSTGLTLVDVAKNPNYITEEATKKIISSNLERKFKEEQGTPAHDKEVFDLLTETSGATYLSLGLAEPMVAIDCGMSFVVHLDKNFDSEEVMLKQDANEEISVEMVKGIVNKCINLPVEKRLEALVKVANPIENWQSVFDLKKAPNAKGVQITDNAQKLTNLVQDSTVEINEKQKMLAGIEKGLDAAYKQNTWFLQRWIGWGDAKQYKEAINVVAGKRMSLATAHDVEAMPDTKPLAVTQTKKVDLGLGTGIKQLSPDPAHLDTPAVTKDRDIVSPQ